MGRKARNLQRALGMRKQPNAPKKPFVEAKVRELQAMDAEVERAMRGETR